MGVRSAIGLFSLLFVLYGYLWSYGGRLTMLIVFEGIDGSGKSTQAKMFADWLEKEKGERACLAFEPGGTDIGRQIRQILLSKDNDEMTPLTEALLYAADRAQHIEECVAPSIRDGFTVVCDRMFSTFAYQGVSIDTMVLWELNGPALWKLEPVIGAGEAVTFFLDVPVKDCIDRLSRAGKMDRMESKGYEYLVKVRDNYLKLMQSIPMVKIDCEGLTAEEVQKAIRKKYEQLMFINKGD